MGRASKKIKRTLKNGRKEEMLLQLERAIEEIQNRKLEGHYEAALEMVIASFEKFGVRTETAYEAAETYYLTGDYERAATWCSNVLDLQGFHPATVLLLAKIALMKDQSEDALELLEKLISEGAARNSEHREQMEDLLQIILIDHEADEIQKQHPNLWEALKTTIDEDLSTYSDFDEVHVENEESSLSQLDQSIVMDDEEVKESEHSLADSTQEDEEAHKTAEAIQAEIMALSVSLKEKVEICHHHAAMYYERGDIGEALAVLRLALAIDAKDDLTLKNIGFILLEAGEREEALSYFRQVKEVDLMISKCISQNDGE